MPATGRPAYLKEMIHLIRVDNMPTGVGCFTYQQEANPPTTDRDKMSPFRTKCRWQKGTYMRLASKERFKTLVYTKEDMEAIRMGRPVDFRKISQRKLAKRVGVHPSFINHLVSGYRTDCTTEVAENIAEVFGLDVTVLFDPQEPISNRQSA
ncbi:hypothetical protein B879_04211 [Cecembia lonarensis LW9]|uniref:HTH cro/C1-type domain-containing protein n=2 Tax=Bacteria TaxID=2 RepID=K1KXI7_CECL9|nr:hypothetical protein B879_04211 [Cecembia lonarensis LW9]